MRCLSGRIYDACLGTLLKGTRRWVAGHVGRYGLYPALDLCTGTAALCRLMEGPSHSIWGLDLDRHVLRYARSRARHIPLVCADAAQIPFKSGVFRAVIISYALHEKTQGLRSLMLAEARRVLDPCRGRLIVIDFEMPWDRVSRLGRMFTYLIERLAGGDHFRNGQRFVRQGGLSAIIRDQGLIELQSLPLAWGSSRIVVARWPS